MRRKELEGRRFGRLLVLRYHSSNRYGPNWVCSCDCGGEKIVDTSSLTAGLVKSCGCLRNTGPVTHGETRGGRSPEYRAWIKMRERCRNPKDPSYKNYGARGITVCKRWKKFKNFLEDMGRRPSPHHTLDRKDNEGGYMPENCRWATKEEQSSNTRRNHLVTFKGKTDTLTHWANELGIKQPTLRRRLQRGWSVKRAFTESVRGS